MSRPAWTPFVTEGPQRVRFRSEGDNLLRETVQDGYNPLMESIRTEALDAPRQPYLGGYKVGSIPLNDWPAVCAKYPEFALDGNADLKKKALVRFSNDPDMAQYLIKGA